MSFHKKLIQHRQLRSIIIIFVFILGGVSIWLKSVEIWLAAFFFLNMVGWLLIYVDKRRSNKKGSFRIPEVTFFILSLLGGGMGTWTAMNVYRHKTKHLSFKIGIPFLGLLHVGLILYAIVHL
jgi:uncharacterized membrane protein YsdA (DUF1294 family)